MLTVIDNGMGNIQSVVNAISQLNEKCHISNHPSDIKWASAIIFPGVGSFPMAMSNLEKSSLLEVVKEQIYEKNTPFLGICLGMQLLFESSEERRLTPGLNLLKGKVRRIQYKRGLTVPHVGWNNVRIEKDNPLFANISTDAMFYYDHSYYITSTDDGVFATLNYGSEMVVGVWKENLFGVQFHPEKSQRNGLKLLRNFLDYAYKS